jgi:hypothetical protein
MAVLLLKPAPVVPALAGGCSLAFSTSVAYHAPTGTPSGKRIYLFHGYNSPGMWTSSTPLDLVNGLKADGHEVVLPVLPDGQTCFFANGGWQYREQFIAALNTIKASVETAHGPATKNIVGGISYGGLHAMMAAASTGHFTGWFAHLPVTRVDALTELSGVGDAKRFNPFFDVGSLKDTNGFITWGTADTRVNYLLTVALASQMGSVIGQPYPGQDHYTNATNVADMRTWVAGL